MRLGCNCSVGPLQAKLKIIRRKADGVKSVVRPLPLKRKKPTRAESEGGECQAGLSWAYSRELS